VHDATVQASAIASLEEKNAALIIARDIEEKKSRRQIERLRKTLQTPPRNRQRLDSIEEEDEIYAYGADEDASEVFKSERWDKGET